MFVRLVQSASAPEFQGQTACVEGKPCIQSKQETDKIVARDKPHADSHWHVTIMSNVLAVLDLVMHHEFNAVADWLKTNLRSPQVTVHPVVKACLQHKDGD